MNLYENPSLEIGKTYVHVFYQSGRFPVSLRSWIDLETPKSPRAVENCEHLVFLVWNNDPLPTWSQKHIRNAPKRGAFCFIFV